MCAEIPLLLESEEHSVDAPCSSGTWEQPKRTYMKGVETDSFTKRFMTEVSPQLMDHLVEVALRHK